MADKTDIPETTLPQSPLERVVQAAKDYSPLSWGFNPEDDDHWRDFARAVLQAIREPSEAIEDAGFQIIGEFGELMKPRHMWQAMIDAALEEG